MEDSTRDSKVLTNKLHEEALEVQETLKRLLDEINRLLEKTRRLNTNIDGLDAPLSTKPAEA